MNNRNKLLRSFRSVLYDFAVRNAENRVNRTILKSNKIVFSCAPIVKHHPPCPAVRIPQTHHLSMCLFLPWKLQTTSIMEKKKPTKHWTLVFLFREYISTTFTSSSVWFFLLSCFMFWIWFDLISLFFFSCFSSKIIHKMECFFILQSNAFPKYFWQMDEKDYPATEESVTENCRQRIDAVDC